MMFVTSIHFTYFVVVVCSYNDLLMSFSICLSDPFTTGHLSWPRLLDHHDIVTSGSVIFSIFLLFFKHRNRVCVYREGDMGELWGIH